MTKFRLDITNGVDDYCNMKFKNLLDEKEEEKWWNIVINVKKRKKEKNESDIGKKKFDGKVL